MNKRLLPVFCTVALLLFAAAFNSSVHAKSGSSGQDQSRPQLEFGNVYVRETDDNNKTVYVSGNYDMLRLSEDSRKEYAQLSSALDEHMSARTKEIKDLINSLKVAYSKDSSTSEAAPQGYEITDSIYVHRADRKVLSMLISRYSFAGGAHGSYSYTSLNLDSSSGKNISLGEIIDDRKELKEVLKKELHNKYSGEELFDDMEDILNKAVDQGFANSESKNADDENPMAWTLDPQGITIFFNPYVLGPYATGAPSVTILYSSHKDLFTDSYRPEGGQGYICNIPLDSEYYMDVDKDGIADCINVHCNVDSEDDNIKDFSVSVDGEKTAIDDIYYFSLEPKVVLTNDGRAFLYAWCKGDNDYMNMYMFDLSSGHPESEGTMAVSETYINTNDDTADYVPYRLLLTDPDNMPLSTRFDILSTYDGEKIYSVRDGVAPVSDDPYYSIQADITIVSKKDIDVSLVDEEGKVTESNVTIPSGTSFKLFRTDGENCVDALLKDGRIVRFTVTGTYPQYINDVDVNDLFEQLYFAG